MAFRDTDDNRQKPVLHNITWDDPNSNNFKNTGINMADLIVQVLHCALSNIFCKKLTCMFWTNQISWCISGLAIIFKSLRVQIPNK